MKLPGKSLMMWSNIVTRNIRRYMAHLYSRLEKFTHAMCTTWRHSMSFCFHTFNLR